MYVFIANCRKIYKHIEVDRLIRYNVREWWRLKKYADKEKSDVLISGLLLKYIGRVKQFNFDCVFSYSDIGSKESCSILSRDIIIEAEKKCNDISKSNLTELIDIVLCDDFDSGTNGDIVNFIFSLEQCFFN